MDKRNEEECRIEREKKEFVLKFASIIILEGFDLDAKLSAHEKTKINKSLRNIRFVAMGEGPRKMAKIIK